MVTVFQTGTTKVSCFWYEEILKNHTGDGMTKPQIFEFSQKQKCENHFYSRSKPHILKFEKGDI